MSTGTVQSAAGANDSRWVYGQPGFVVTRDGRIYRLSDGHLIPSKTYRRYPVVSLGGQTRLVHRVVCESFHGPSPCEDCEVHHKDHNPQNSHADNLEWLTPAEHRAKHPRPKRCAERPQKPRPDFPLFPNQNGLWAKKINGRAFYFGSWCSDRDGQRALALLKEFMQETPPVARTASKRRRVARLPATTSPRHPRSHELVHLPPTQRRTSKRLSTPNGGKRHADH